MRATSRFAAAPAATEVTARWSEPVTPERDRRRQTGLCFGGAIVALVFFLRSAR